jgi:hypothetical protein
MRVDLEMSERLLNDFATRSFRDMADHDYIAARMCYRARLVPQFIWGALQAIEKYLKCILLLNRIPAKHLRHDIAAALELVNKKAPFRLRLSPSTEQLIRHLDTYGRFRYLEASFYVRELMLQKLDKAVWEIRRYCGVLKYEISLADGTSKQMLDMELERIERSEKARHEFRHIGGELEKILDNRKHPARPQLVWQNFCYGVRRRKRIRVSYYSHATNVPLSLHPEILDEVMRYVYLPKDVAKAYREELIRSDAELEILQALGANKPPQ